MKRAPGRDALARRLPDDAAKPITVKVRRMREPSWQMAKERRGPRDAAGEPGLTGDCGRAMEGSGDGGPFCGGFTGDVRRICKLG